MKLVFIALMILFIGCTQVKQEFPKDQLVDCATVDVGRTLPDIGMTLVAYIVEIANAPDRVASFKKILTAYGRNTTACSMRVAADVLKKLSDRVQMPNTLMAVTPADTAVRDFIQQNGWQFR